MAKSVLITGCSSGIGHALAVEFHSRGLRVFAASRSLESMESLAKNGIELIRLDPTDPESISLARADVAKATGGKLDILVNNAGQWLESPAIETELSSVKALFDINVFGPMEIVKQFSPLLISAKGTIVNHSSMTKYMPHPMTAAYNASKAALSQYSNTLRLELEPVNVRVIELVTGRVSTKLISLPSLNDTSIYKPLEPALQSRAKEAEKMQKPDVFAKAVVKHILSSSPNPWVYKGNVATIAWIVANFGPNWAFDSLMKSMTGLGKFRNEIANRASAS
ncbi:NADPH-dependent 1-acyldihydroxyacetone phosphate reductase [Talaromyces pinophilus]|nr:NADPH-dependent 1-acyldihydroxyacetone phosphate reductase [Talaromyces pinophilus]